MRRALVGDEIFDFEGLFEVLPDGVAYADASGIVHRANTAFLRLFGFRRRGDVFGLPLHELLASPGEVERMRAVFAMAPAEGKLLRDGGEVECSLRHRTGRVFRGEVAIRALRGDEDRKLRCVYIRDVEEKYSARTALLEVSERLKALVAASPLAIMIFDLDGVTHLWNPAAERMFGYSAEEVVGRFLPGVPGLKKLEFKHYLRKTGTGATLSAFETVRRRKDGELLTVALWTAPIRGCDGATQCLSIVADITQRKQMEQKLAAHVEALARETRLKDDFLAMLSHELRNPLSPLVSAASLLREHTDGSETSRRTLDVVDRQLRKLQRLVDDLLDVSRIHRDKLDIRREELSIGDVVEGSLQTVRSLSQARGHTLRISVAEDLWVQGDPVRLEQVFGNLLHNAVKYTNAGGFIEVSGVLEGDSVVVRIRDTGVGIPHDALETLFLPFAQAERSLHLAEGGLGIGLALVRALVDLHGGTVSARSEGPGYGSEFEVRLPAIASPEPQVRAKHSSVPPHPDTRKSVLLVDDNEDAVAMLAELIGHWGHSTVGVLDGAAALEAASGKLFDVAFVDIDMPKMSGYELAERLRQLPNGKRTRLIALTGHGGDTDRERSAEAGFSYHLVKPVDSTALLAVLAEKPSSSKLSRQY